AAFYAEQAAYNRVSEIRQEPSALRPDPGTGLKPVELPVIDESRISAEQTALWRDLRSRFLNTAAQVHEARVNLDQLSRRLFRQNMSLNGQDASLAVLMNGFLEDAAKQISTGQFESAFESLVRADYTRRKLRGVTGQ
ncbi:MAG TPA: hypothetical protein VH744_09680, partial [Terriglobales bacterium]